MYVHYNIFWQIIGRILRAKIDRLSANRSNTFLNNLCKKINLPKMTRAVVFCSRFSRKFVNMFFQSIIQQNLRNSQSSFPTRDQKFADNILFTRTKHSPALLAKTKTNSIRNNKICEKYNLGVLEKRSTNTFWHAFKKIAMQAFCGR